MNAKRPMLLAQSKGRNPRIVDLWSCLLVSAFVITAAPGLNAQNLYFENYTDCNYTVNVRYADVNCDYSSYPQYSPSNVCDPNVGTGTYSAPHLVNTSYTTPHGSQICSVNVLDLSNTVVASCTCGQGSCHVDDVPCMSGYIDIDITVAQFTTTIKWLP
jgi:hypothetical protein